MSGLCGWFAREPVMDAEGTTERMAHALPRYGDQQRRVASGATFGLALQTHPATGSFAEEAGVIAAIEGYPTWRDAALSEIAHRDGHARALIRAYRQRGANLFEALRGTFSFAIIDRDEGKALCAIDRFGIQPLCYAEPAPGLVVFGSTTDAVRAHPRVSSTIAVQSVFNYIYFVDRIPAPATIYREQRKLAPAECLLVSRESSCKTYTYWQMPYRTATGGDKAATRQELRARLRRAVEESMAGEETSRVGAFLSGGLDSSSVVGMASEIVPHPFQSFTIGFPVEGFDETYYAEIAAKHYHTKHQTYYLQPQDIVDILLKSVQIYDEPFANSSLVPAFYCARLGKDAGVEMMLAGDGGDELFAGNKQYVEDAVFDHYQRLPGFVRSALLEPLSEHVPSALSVGFLGKLLRYVERAKRTVPARMASNLFQALPPGEIFSSDALGEIDLGDPESLASSIYAQPKEATKIQRMMHLDLRVLLADSDLRKVLRMCELAGVRVRFPFLNDDLAEFAASIPEAWLVEGGGLRRFYKDAMTGFLPDEIINKKKHGFGLPYTAFMSTDKKLRELIGDNLTALRGRKYFRPAFLDDLIDRARGGVLSGHETAAWDLIVLNLWLESRGRPLPTTAG